MMKAALTSSSSLRSKLIPMGTVTAPASTVNKLGQRSLRGIT